LNPIDVQQLNGSETFSLLKFETTKAPVWFKAVGEPNVREFLITLKLFELFPDYVPKILASAPLLNGCSPTSTAPNRVARPCGGIATSGCRDLRLETLRELDAVQFSGAGSIPNAFCTEADFTCGNCFPSIN